ncbi:MAG: hypothetical protein Q9227_008846 [Pyrenula ochraceoflavens]
MEGKANQRFQAARELQAKVKGLKAGLDNVAAELPKLKPYKPPKTIDFDVDCTLLDAEQADMNAEWALNSLGGLCRSVYRRTQVHSAAYGDKSGRHEVIIRDYTGNGAKMMSSLLTSVHHRFVSELINGTASSSDFGDDKFRDIISANHKLTHTPGIYLNIISRARFCNGQRQEKPGYGLTWRQFATVVENVEKYIEESEEGKRQRKAVDRAMPAYTSEHRPDESEYDEGRGRYLTSIMGKDKEKVEEWVEAARKTWLAPGQAIFDQNSSDPRLDIPMKRCLQEIGWSIRCAVRAADHPSHKSTNKLFGVVHATIEHLFRGCFEIKQYMVFKVMAERYAPIAEYLASELASSYWYQGGLNPVLAGNMSIGDDAEEWFRRNRGNFFRENLRPEMLQYHQHLTDKSVEHAEWMRSPDRAREEIDYRRDRTQLQAEATNLCSDLERVTIQTGFDAMEEAFQRCLKPGNKS